MTDLERVERACRKVADKIRSMSVGSPDDCQYHRIAQSYDDLADEIAKEVEEARQAEIEFLDAQPTGEFGHE